MVVKERCVSPMFISERLNNPLKCVIDSVWTGWVSRNIIKTFLALIWITLLKLDQECKMTNPVSLMSLKINWAKNYVRIVSQWFMFIYELGSIFNYLK